MLAKEAWQEMFEKRVTDDPHLPQPVATMQVIQASLYRDDSTTLQELIERMKFVREALCNTPSASVVVESAGEMFTRFITRAPTAIESAQTFEEVRRILISRGEDFLETIQSVPSNVSKYTLSLFKNLQNPVSYVVTHSRNPCVLQTLIDIQQKYRFKVYVTEGQPRCHGRAMVDELRVAGVAAELVLDSAIAYYVEQCTLVLLGAEAVCPNGGIIGQIGTATMAATAKMFGKRVYVLVESYRFTFHTPLNSRSLSVQQMYGPRATERPVDQSPSIDYTPPEHIRYFYTDIGQMHPIAADENLRRIFT